MGKKGSHWQLPGGRVDKTDASAVEAAARELFEETGIEIRKDLTRMLPAGCFNSRCFFKLALGDDDSQQEGVQPLSGQPFRLLLSKEHEAFTFEPNLARAAQMVELHSGGHCSRALRQLEC